MKSSIAILASAALLGCGGSATGPRPIPLAPDLGPPTALRVDAPLFVPGEFMAWDLTWKGIQGGTTRLLVGEPGMVGDRAAIIVRSETRSDGLLAMFRHVRDDLITTVDLASALPMTSSGKFEWGKPREAIKNSRVEVTYREGAFDIAYERSGAPTRRWTQHLPAGARVYDTHAALGALRAWRPADGSRAYFYAVSGRRLYRIDLAFAGADSVRTSLGRFSAVRIEGTGTRLTQSLDLHPKRKPRSFTVWISDDEDRVPLRVEAHTEFGSVVVELTDYDRGARPPVAAR